MVKLTARSVRPASAGRTRSSISFPQAARPARIRSSSSSWSSISRQHYRGRVNRTLRVLELEGEGLPEYDAELELDGKVVGRVTSATRDGDAVVALAYVRVEVPRNAALRLGARAVTQLDLPSPRP